ncbi:hypothetical protein EJ03DRAFT_324048 [Teratosphaeria nubilosa]|uniref:Uncharacterized protein n=1 Tax=Teratosphaeria nubilosa TaxID=161662 RepID=A0A6G1LKP6_9PEZI|nr:hypothetical protein EJ03DRAFT_324048 [Teratosphaeria nubilosa]
MRRIIYGISLWAFVAAAALTIAAIALPDWVSFTSPTSDSPIRVTYGLHQRCSSITGQCTKFPQYEDCVGDDKYFCSMWRSTGFLMNFSVIMELAVLVAYLTILVGGRASREAGWKVLASLLSVVAAAQVIAMALVAYLYDHDNRFFAGWHLDKSWVLCTVSWSIIAIDALGIVAAKLVLPPEDDYEQIADGE